MDVDDRCVLDADCLKGMIFGRELVQHGFSVFLLSIELLISDSKPYMLFYLVRP